VPLAGPGARAARLSGRRVLWGLLVPAYAGFVWSLARSLTEIISATTMLGGLLALRARRPVLAAGSLSAAGLTRETAMVVTFALGIARSWTWVRQRRVTLERTDLAWFAPAVAFVAWQAWCRVVTGQVPALRSLEVHLVRPMTGPSAFGWLRVADASAAVEKVVQITTLGLVAAMALWVWARGRCRLHEGLAVVLALILSWRVLPMVWNDWHGFRAYGDLFALSAFVLLVGGSRRALTAASMAVAVAWFLTVGTVRTMV
jgi:hypothetical protein